MNRQIGPLARAIDCEEAQAHYARVVQVRIRMTEQLAGCFRRCIRRNRIKNRIVLAERDLRVHAVHGGRRTEDKLLHAMRASELEQIQRAIDVCLDVKPRLFQ